MAMDGMECAGMDQSAPNSGMTIKCWVMCHVLTVADVQAAFDLRTAGIGSQGAIAFHAAPLIGSFANVPTPPPDLV